MVTADKSCTTFVSSNLLVPAPHLVLFPYFLDSSPLCRLAISRRIAPQVPQPTKLCPSVPESPGQTPLLWEVCPDFSGQNLHDAASTPLNCIQPAVLSLPNLYLPAC